MGNEQSTSNSGGGGNTGVSTSLSFLANKKQKESSSSSSSSSASSSKATGTGRVVVVRTGVDPLPTPANDEILKRFVEIPKFYPILRSALNQAGLRDPPDVTMKLSSRPILKFAYRLQEHFAQCALTVATEQDALSAIIKSVDYALSSIIIKLTERKKRFDRLATELERARQLQTQMINIRFLLEDMVPCVETLNEILPVEERLPTLNLGRVLERTPAVSSAESSPEHNTAGIGNRTTRLGDSITSTHHHLHIEPVEELTVIDKPNNTPPQRRS